MENTLEPIFNYQSPTNLVAASLLLLNGIFGVGCNSQIVYIFSKEKSERTSFNLICLFRSILNNYVLITSFLAVFLPVTIFMEPEQILDFSEWNSCMAIDSFSRRNGIIGVVCNSLIIYIFTKEKSEQTSFNLICLFRSIFNNYVLITSFLLVFLPVTILGFSPYSPYFETWNISLSKTFYIGNDYLTILVAINRFISLFFPFKYPIICGNKITLAILIVVYGHWIVALFFEVEESFAINCFTTFTATELTWMSTMEKRCFKDENSILYFVAGTLSFVFLMNTLTFVKVIKFYMNVARIDLSSRVEIKKNILLFFQTLLQDSLFVVDIVFTFTLSTLSQNRFWTFLSGTLVWQSVHSLDGFIMMMFNEKLAKMRKRSSVRNGSGPISHPISVVVTHLPAIDS